MVETTYTIKIQTLMSSLGLKVWHAHFIRI
jgi:hypothetical protein